MGKIYCWLWGKDNFRGRGKKKNPDYFFVMPYGFIKEFIKREKKWLKGGGRFILPYPNFKILN